MLKLKEGVTGFVYNTTHGFIKTSFTQPTMGMMLTDEDDMFVDDENVNELFEIKSQEQLEQDDEGLSEVLVWIDMPGTETKGWPIGAGMKKASNGLQWCEVGESVTNAVYMYIRIYVYM